MLYGANLPTFQIHVLPPSPNLEMEAVNSYETSVNLYQATWCHIPYLLTFVLHYAYYCFIGYR